jgi:hypothetical protein
MMNLSKESMAQLIDLYQSRIECLERELKKAKNLSGYQYIMNTTNNQKNEQE